MTLRIAVNQFEGGSCSTKSMMMDVLVSEVAGEDRRDDGARAVTLAEDACDTNFLQPVRMLGQV
jgi:hypothetical protein